MRIHLPYRITIEQQTTAADTYGGASTVTWSPFAVVWADYETITGREYFGSAQVNAATTVKFHIRSLAGLDTSMRVNFDGDLFDIKAILDSWKADILILAEKVART